MGAAGAEHIGGQDGRLARAPARVGACKWGMQVQRAGGGEGPKSWGVRALAVAAVGGVGGGGGCARWCSALLACWAGGGREVVGHNRQPTAGAVRRQ